MFDILKMSLNFPDFQCVSVECVCVIMCVLYVSMYTYYIIALHL